MKKNLVILVILVVFGMFSVVSAMAQIQKTPNDPFGFFDFFEGQGRQRGGVGAATAGAAVSEETADESLDLVSAEILRAFVEKGFTIAPEEATAVFVAEVKIFSRERVGISSSGYYRYTYHRDPESIIYVVVRRVNNGGVVVVGRGKSSNIRRAAEKAANDAAKKLQRLYKKPEDGIIFLP